MVIKLCVVKLRVSKLCGDKLCVSKRAGRGGMGGAEVHNKKQEPHTKMWGKTHHSRTTFGS